MAKTLNRALAYMVLAGTCLRQGNHAKAALAFEQAAMHPDFITLTTATRALASRVKASRTVASTRRVKAAGWPFTQTAQVGQEFREEPDQNKTMREVQEAGLDDDLSLMGLDDGSEMQMADEVDNFDPPIEVDDDGLATELSEAEDDEEDEDEGDKEESRATASARFARALQNATAQRAAAKKKKPVKKPVKK